MCLFWWQQRKAFNIIRLLVRHTTAMGAAKLGEDVKGKGHWDSLPWSLAWAVNTAAMSSWWLEHLQENSSWWTRCFKHRRSVWHANPQNLEATTAPSPSALVQHGWLTRCLVDCCHYVTNWWIINQNTRAGSRPDALRLSQPISRLPLESRVTLETEVLAESKVGDSTAMTQSI